MRHELPNPLAIKHIGLAARGLPGGARVDEINIKTASIQHFKKRDPVNPRRLHGHHVDAQRLEPIGQDNQIIGEGGKLTNRNITLIRTYGRPVFSAANINAGTVVMDNLKTLLVLARHNNSSQD